MTSADAPDPLWTIHDVSAYLRIPVETLRTWRKRGDGPPAHKMGKHLRYAPTAVRRWAEREAGQ